MQQCCGKSQKMATLEDLESKITELTESLNATNEANKGLKADLTKAKAELRKGQEIDPNEFLALQTSSEELKNKLGIATNDLKKITAERDIALKTLETESGITLAMQKESDLMNALAGINVTNPINQKAAKAILAAQVQVVTDGDKRVSKVGDKLLVDYLKETWAATDEGKHFITAPNNNGGGAQGGGTSSNSKTMTRAQFDAADQGTRAEFAKGGGRVTD